MSSQGASSSGQTDDMHERHVVYRPHLPHQMVNGPFLALLNDLFIPELIQHPLWLVNLKITKHNVCLYMLQEAEDHLFDLIRDVTHPSFLQFCINLLHDRFVEYGHLEQLQMQMPCPIVFTGPAVISAIQKYMRILEFRSLDTSNDPDEVL